MLVYCSKTKTNLGANDEVNIFLSPSHLGVTMVTVVTLVTSAEHILTVCNRYIRKTIMITEQNRIGKITRTCEN